MVQMYSALHAPSNCVRLHGSDEGQKWETISNAIDEYEFSVYQPYVLRAQVIQMVFMGMTDVEGQFWNGCKHKLKRYRSVKWLNK